MASEETSESIESSFIFDKNMSFNEQETEWLIQAEDHFSKKKLDCNHLTF